MQAQLTKPTRGPTTIAPPPAALESADAASAAQIDPDPEQEVRQIAYALYEARGCVDGHDLEDWLTAETQVRQALADPAPAVAAAPTGH